VILISPVLDI